MRFTATALATILAILVISGTRPTLSGMSSMPPCELEPQVPATTRPPAPKRLRIVPGVEELLEDLFVSGPHAAADTPSPTETAAAIADPHAYYVALASRADCFAAYSLRNAAQVASYRAPRAARIDMSYIYPNDPDRRAQDAMRIVLPEGNKGTAEQLRVPMGPSSGSHVLFVMDWWMGAEWRHAHSRLTQHKVTPIMFLFEGNSAGVVGMQLEYLNAGQHEQNQPPGGPFVALPYSHVNDGGVVKTPNWWRDSMTGFPRGKVPYTAPSGETRTYTESIQPFDTSVNPGGAELGLVPERWHRIWHYFERAPGEDWISDSKTFNGQKMAAYKWSVWMADTVRAPIRQVNEAIIGVPITASKQWVQAKMGMGGGDASGSTLYAGRGDLIAYTRNWVVLHGTSKPAVLALLQKPVP